MGRRDLPQLALDLVDGRSRQPGKQLPGDRDVADLLCEVVDLPLALNRSRVCRPVEHAAVAQVGEFGLAFGQGDLAGGGGGLGGGRGCLPWLFSWFAGPRGAPGG